MLDFVDKQLNRVTMYRLVLYYLSALLGVALLLSFAGVLHYDPYALLFTAGVEVAVCGITNALFARAFGVPANVESVYISALILALIITPLQTTHDLWFLLWSGVLAMASKYIVALRGKHLFNPVAFAVALTYLALDQSASWWVGSAPMLPFVLLGGLLIVRKLRRFDLVSTFLLAALAAIVGLSILNRQDVLATLQQTVVSSPLLFFACIILTEPLTMPPTRRLRIVYGVLVGLLSAPQLHVGSLYITPELAILIGNIFSYVVSPRTARILRLKERVRLAPDIFEFSFVPARKLAFAPGQYMEWTLDHADPDARGNRRYFTLASSPTEEQVKVGVRFSAASSSFKQALLGLDASHEIVAAQVSGDFVLPRDPQQKCVFIAGGIGITPFRSMLKYLLDTHQPRPIVLFYANRSVEDIVYQDVLDRAERELGIKTIYTVSDRRTVPHSWKGKIGHITSQMITNAVPDYDACRFYISGPPSMVDDFKVALHRLGIRGDQIKTDYFAGLA